MAEEGLLFSEEFLRRLEHLAMVARRPVSGHLRGHHRSRRTGTGMVFSDYRPYSPGDDTRNLDWGTYLRLDRLILRLFEEEADLPVYIFLDVSRSMAFGTPGKLAFAKRMAAALAYIALVNHDRVSVVAFADGIVQELPARRGKNQVWRTLRFLERVGPSGGTSLQAAFAAFFGAARTRGLAIVISDFLQSDGVERNFQAIRRHRHDVFAVHVVSPDEANPALSGEVLLVDAETGSSARALVTQAMLEEYRQTFERHRLGIEAFCRAHGWGYVLGSTAAPLEQIMLTALRNEGLLI